MTSGGKLNYVHYTGKTKARGIMSLIKRGHDQGEREKGNEGRPLPGPQCPQPCQRCVWPRSVGLRSQDCISWAADSRNSCGWCFIHAPSRWSSIRRSTEWPEALPPPVQPSLTPLLFNSNTVVVDLPCSWNCVNTWQTSYFTLPTTLSLGTVILMLDTLGGTMSCPR